MWAILAWFGLTALSALALIAVGIKEWADRGRERREWDPIDPLWNDFDRSMRKPR